MNVGDLIYGMTYRRRDGDPPIGDQMKAVARVTVVMHFVQELKTEFLDTVSVETESYEPA